MEKSKTNSKLFLILTLASLSFILFSNTKVMGQELKRIYRIAKIQVAPAKLDEYNAALKEQMTTAIRLEPGVLSYYAVADKKDPAHITIFEIYADSAAYQSHIQTPHFKMYKETVKDMVKSLELEDVGLIAFASKPIQ
jgi:quinol monooxygenase YgiN